MLEALSSTALLQNVHLELLWAAAEQEGTFDEIKTNVYGIIENLAVHLSQPHLDLLFGKLFRDVQGRSLTHTLGLLELLRKLAKNDVRVR